MKLTDQIKFCKDKIGRGHQDHKTYRAITDSLVFLSELAPGYQSEDGLYQECIAAYDDFLKKHIGVGVKMNPGQGKAMKEIIKYLTLHSKDKSAAGVLASWQYILLHWDKQNEFIGKQKNLTQINKNLIEILDNIRNGNTKATKERNNQAKQQLRDSIKSRG
ncbi:hypothetical protein [Reichenbachiella sp.]|uniref:hypothetical protein n=1 Tax=Reichenbachiella sp. TaxID=2184521 RepID=UPI003B59F398